jgi:teichuronic acid biosynthesis glycosyltransferase TuaC
MKVLFVCSGNKNSGKAGVVVGNQAESLIRSEVDISFFLIKGKGVKGYLAAVFPLIQQLRNQSYDVIHSHYSLSAFVASIALLISRNKTPHVVSLMGSDAKMSGWKKRLSVFLHRSNWKKTIVKSEQMAKDLGLNRFTVIPNGVDLDKFHPGNHHFNNEEEKKRVLFPADPSRESKNYPLAEQAMKLVNELRKDIALQVLYNVPQKEVINAIQKAYCVLVPSRWEGSPNIVKESMACSKSIVATKVGDIPWLLKRLDGCYLVDAQAQDVAEAIIKAVDYCTVHQQTQGRERIKELGIDSESIAKKIKGIYAELSR